MLIQALNWQQGESLVKDSVSGRREMWEEENDYEQGFVRRQEKNDEGIEAIEQGGN